MMETIKEIATTELKAHPDNPRLVLREDVIEGIAEQLKESGHFDPAHALLVRPLNGHYQIVRGHHRWEGAKQAGIDTLPCWVRDMSDEEAYMQLALGNVQGELSPLEIGVHALGVEFDKRGKGASGNGLKGYADSLGQDTGNITRYRQAAETLINCNITINEDILKKANHLAAIHKAPQDLWPMLAEWVITPKDPKKPDNTPSVNQTQDLVKEVNKFDIPDEWQSVFLPLADVVKSYMDNGTPDAKAVSALVNEARNTEQIILAHSERLDPERFTYSLDGFRDWLRGGIGTYAWDVKQLAEYRQDVISQAREAERPPAPDVKPGEWYKLGEHILYCGDTGKPEFWQDLPEAAFAFADPPYNAGVDEWDHDFEWAHDWLIEKAPIVAVTPGIESIQTFYRDQTQMPHAWAISAWIKNGMTRGKLGYGNWVYIGIFSQPDTELHRQAQDHLELSIRTSDTKDSEHKGRKPPELMQQLIELFTKSGETIIDPFLGSGTTLFEADGLGRVCIGGEIRSDFCNEIIDRWQEKTGQIAERIAK